MANDNEKVEVEVKPLYQHLIVVPHVENPYLIKETEDGFTRTNGIFENPDSGNIDKKDSPITVGRVVSVGPACKYVAEGDDVMFDIRSTRPVPIYDNGFLVVPENSLLCVIGFDLNERFKAVHD